MTPGSHNPRAQSGPPPGPVPGPLGRFAARFYGAEVARRNRRFDAGLGVVRLPVPVVSVGNLSVGGTGKTPVVMRLAAMLASHRHRPVIAMRGYRAGEDGSDEAAEYARRLPEVAVVAQADRVAGLRPLLAREPASIILLDDGFQHRRIARDLDIVLLDATRDPFEDRLLPVGWLREPVSGLTRAGVALVMHAERVDEGTVRAVRERALAVNPGLVTAVTRHVWRGLKVERQCGEDAELGGSQLRGRQVVAVCAIGNPEAFLAAAREAVGGPLAGSIVLRDHDPYAGRTVDRIVADAAGADFILTTEKDWSKLARVEKGRWPCPVVRPILGIDFDEGEAGVMAAVLSACGAGRV